MDLGETRDEVLGLVEIGIGDIDGTDSWTCSIYTEWHIDNTNSEY
jgi:hypothetical protein